MPHMKIERTLVFEVSHGTDEEAENWVWIIDEMLKSFIHIIDPIWTGEQVYIRDLPTDTE